MSSTRVTIKKNGRDVHIGHILRSKIRGGVFVRKMKPSVHLYRKLDAFGIDANVFTTMIEPDVKFIRIEDIEGGFTYITRTSFWRKHGVFLHFKQEQADHHAQIFLPRLYFRKYRDGALIKDYPPCILQELKPKQTKLF